MTHSTMFRKVESAEDADLLLTFTVIYMNNLPVGNDWQYAKEGYKPAIQGEIVGRRSGSDEIWFRQRPSNMQGEDWWMYASEQVTSRTHRSLEPFWAEMGEVIIEEAEKALLENWDK